MSERGGSFGRVGTMSRAPLLSVGRSFGGESALSSRVSTGFRATPSVRGEGQFGSSSLPSNSTAEGSSGVGPRLTLDRRGINESVRVLSGNAMLQTDGSKPLDKPSFAAPEKIQTRLEETGDTSVEAIIPRSTPEIASAEDSEAKKNAITAELAAIGATSLSPQKPTEKEPLDTAKTSGKTDANSEEAQQQAARKKSIDSDDAAAFLQYLEELERKRQKKLDALLSRVGQ